MKLNELSIIPGSRMRHTRVGRGSSSGLGKTAGKGVKGQHARAGVAVNGFEGGQMPLYMRIPKRGFNNIFANDFAVINLDRLQKAIDDGKLKAGEAITNESLRAARLVRRSRDGVRILGEGKLTAKVALEVAGASKAAIDAVKKAGGSVKITFEKKVHMNKKGEPGKKALRRKALADKRTQRAAG